MRGRKRSGGKLHMSQEAGAIAEYGEPVSGVANSRGQNCGVIMRLGSRNQARLVGLHCGFQDP